MGVRDSTDTWRGLVEGLDGLGADVWLGAACALLISIIVAVMALFQSRTLKQCRRRLDELEQRDAMRAARDAGPTIQEFCRQIMRALGTETPDAVSARLSEADPARFARVLAVYTRAQRRRLVTLYQQAENLREALSAEESRHTEEQGDKLRDLDQRIELAARQSAELDAACTRATGLLDRIKTGPAAVAMNDKLAAAAHLSDLIAEADRKSDGLRLALDRAESSVSRMTATDSSLSEQLERRKELMERADCHLGERQLLLVTDILRAEAKQLELDDAIGRLDSTVQSLQQATDTSGGAAPVPSEPEMSTN